MVAHRNVVSSAAQQLIINLFGDAFAMGGILAETERQSPDQLQLCFCYMMDLLGIMTEKMPREYFHQTPGQK